MDTRPAFWFIFQNRKILVKAEENRLTVPALNRLDEIGIEPAFSIYLGTLNDRQCYSAEAAEGIPAPEGMAFHGLRSIFGRIDEDLFKMALRAVHLTDWDSNHRHCSRCGATMRMQTDVRVKECPSCGLLDFPRISPAVIVLVERDGKILLARSRRFAEEMYSVLAGFVEPGETLEDTIKREIMEEVAIEVDDIRYFGSQPWPFPDSLMCGFTARYAGGEIKVDEDEIVDAGWFDPDHLPPIPGKISIARALIDWYVEKSRTT
jgi:NAD+ diphosphatase